MARTEGLHVVLESSIAQCRCWSWEILWLGGGRTLGLGFLGCRVVMLGAQNGSPVCRDGWGEYGLAYEHLSLKADN